MVNPWASFFPDLLSQGLASLIGAGIAAGVAILVASRQIAAERRARIEDNAIVRAEQLRSIRASAVHEVLSTASRLIDSGRPALPDRNVDIALSGLLMDGTTDSYDIYDWVRWQLGPSNNANLSAHGRSITYDVVRGMLLEWMQPGGEEGVLAATRIEMAKKREHD